MKTIIRIFNIVFMAFSAVALVLLFAMPTVSLNVNYSMTAEQISNILPEDVTSQIDINRVVGDEKINLGLSLTVTPKALFRSVNGEAKTVINEEFVEPNIRGVVQSLRSPIHKIAKNVAKEMVVNLLVEKIDEQIETYKDAGETKTASQIREAAGLDRNYFYTFTDSIFGAIERENATVTSVCKVTYNSLVDAQHKFNEAGAGLTLPPLNEEYEYAFRSSMVTLLSQTNMLASEEEETIYPIDIIIDGYLVDILRQMDGTVAPEGETLEQKAGLLEGTLTSKIMSFLNDDIYNALAIVLKVLLFGLLFFASIWAFLFIYTFLRTILCKDRPYTFTGPQFWIAGVLQIVAGVGLTIATSIILSSNFVSQVSGGNETAAEAMKGLSASIVTSLFIPSILVMVIFPISIAYGVIKHKYKKTLKEQKIIAKANAQQQ